MKVLLTIDSDKQTFDVEGSESLRDVLRQNNYTSIKCGCDEGKCGCCTVLLDGIPIPSCKIPIGILHNNDIITLKHFMADNTYKDITQGFSKAGISLCGFCNAGKIFAAGNIISKYANPSDDIIFSEVSGLAHCCTDTETLIKGIKYAIEIHKKRLDDDKKQQEKKRQEQEKNGK